MELGTPRTFTRTSVSWPREKIHYFDIEFSSRKEKKEMKKSIFHFAMAIGIFVLVALTFTGCGNQKPIYVSPGLRSTYPELPVTPSSMRKATKEEVAAKKAEEVKYLKNAWQYEVNEYKSSTNTCELKYKYFDLDNFSHKLYFYIPHKELTQPDEWYDLAFEDIGLSKSRYQAVVRGAGGKYLKALVRDYRVNKPARCDIGEGLHSPSNRLDIVSDIYYTIKFSRTEPDLHAVALTLGDAGLTTKTMEAMEASVWFRPPQ